MHIVHCQHLSCLKAVNLLSLLFNLINCTLNQFSLSILALYVWKILKMLADATRQKLPYQNLKTPLPLKGWSKNQLTDKQKSLRRVAFWLILLTGFIKHLFAGLLLAFNFILYKQNNQITYTLITETFKGEMTIFGQLETWRRGCSKLLLFWY